jgi:hypothetical protein
VPESIIPSADTPGPKAFGVSFQMLVRHAVRLPESFRGGCSFGAGAEADLSRRDVLQIGGKHSPAKPVNAGAALSTGLARPSCVLRQAYDPPAQFLDTVGHLV